MCPMQRGIGNSSILNVSTSCQLASAAGGPIGQDLITTSSPSTWSVESIFSMESSVNLPFWPKIREKPWVWGKGEIRPALVWGSSVKLLPSEVGSTAVAWSNFRGGSLLTVNQQVLDRALWGSMSGMCIEKQRFADYSDGESAHNAGAAGDAWSQLDTWFDIIKHYQTIFSQSWEMTPGPESYDTSWKCVATCSLSASKNVLISIFLIIDSSRSTRLSKFGRNASLRILEFAPANLQNVCQQFTRSSRSCIVIAYLEMVVVG